MEGLSDEIKADLRMFGESPLFHSYKEYVMLEAGKCIGEFRWNKSMSETECAYLRGLMFGIEKFYLDVLTEMHGEGRTEKANQLNRDYTEGMVEKLQTNTNDNIGGTL